MGVARSLVCTAVIAWMAIAWIDASPSHADVLCEKEPEVVKGVSVCPSAYQLPTTLYGKDGDVTFFDGQGFQYDCVSSIGIVVDSDLGAGMGLAAQVQTLSFSSCEGSCAATAVVGTPLASLLLATGGGDGEFSYGLLGDPALSLSDCTKLKLSCAYDYVGEQVEVVDNLAAGPTQVEGEKEPFKKSEGGASCPGELFMNADYVLEEPGEGQVYLSES